MCGIFFHNGPVHDKIFHDALFSYERRGPDSQEVYILQNASGVLGHTRLSIMDLSSDGAQPLFSEDRSLVLSCNGEIYNYHALRRSLERAGHIFSSCSDSEVILHAYEEWGDSLLQHLEGMFAFILWDEKERRLFAARDHVGIKPLAYRFEDGCLTIASDTRAIKQLYPELSVDRFALSFMLSLGYIPTPYSVWEGVNKLEAGHWLSFKNGKLETGCYWEPPRAIDPHLSPVDFVPLFETVIKDHLMADVPMGLFLSGGIDSSAIASACVRTGARPDAFTVSFPSSKYDEAPIASDLACSLALRHTVRQLEEENLGELLHETMKAYDEPQGYSALLTMMQVCRMASKEFKAVLSGDGGDEVFAGYRWYNKVGNVKKHKGIAALTHWWKRRKCNENAISTWGDFSQVSLLHAHAARLFPRFFPHEIQQMVRPSQGFSVQDMLSPLQKYYDPSLPFKRALQRVDLMTFCAGSILPKVDRASMHFSLEVRVPFLDRRLIEYGLSLPETEVDVPKQPIRAYLQANSVPSTVLAHPKQGFSLRGLNDMDWDGVACELKEGCLVGNDLLTTEAVDMAVASPRQEGRLWTLLMLERWAEEWVG